MTRRPRFHILSPPLSYSHELAPFSITVVVSLSIILPSSTSLIIICCLLFRSCTSHSHHHSRTAIPPAFVSTIIVIVIHLYLICSRTQTFFVHLSLSPYATPFYAFQPWLFIRYSSSHAFFSLMRCGTTFHSTRINRPPFGGPFFHFTLRRIP